MLEILSVRRNYSTLEARNWSMEIILSPNRLKLKKSARKWAQWPLFLLQFSQFQLQIKLLQKIGLCSKGCFRDDLKISVFLTTILRKLVFLCPVMTTTVFLYEMQAKYECLSHIYEKSLSLFYLDKSKNMANFSKNSINFAWFLEFLLTISEFLMVKFFQKWSFLRNFSDWSWHFQIFTNILGF